MWLLIPQQVVVRDFFHHVKIAVDNSLSTDDLKYAFLIYVKTAFYLQIKQLHILLSF